MTIKVTYALGRFEQYNNVTGYKLVHEILLIEHADTSLHGINMAMAESFEIYTEEVRGE